jgi:hypothetical protein
MSLRRPISKPHFGWFVMFLVVGLLGVGMTGLQAFRASEARDLQRLELKASIEDAPRKTASELLKIVPAGTLKTPWGLTHEQLQALSKKISKYPKYGRGNRVISMLGNADSLRFATNLFFEAFVAAGWASGSGPEQMTPTGYSPGVVFRFHSKSQTAPGLAEIISAMREAGIEPRGVIDETVPAENFDVYIGANPSN